MWSPANNDNPWRPFRCQLASRCASSLESSEKTNRQTVEQNVGPKRSPGYKICVKNTDKEQAKDYSLVQKNLYTFDDNANANMPFRFLYSGIGKVKTCDKQTQTEFCEDSSMKRDTVHKSTAMKIGHSISCDNFVRKCAVKPHASRSFEVGNLVDKDSTGLRPAYTIETFRQNNDRSLLAPQKGNSDTCIINRKKETHDFREISDFPLLKSETFFEHRQTGKLSPNVLRNQGYLESHFDFNHITTETDAYKRFYGDEEEHCRQTMVSQGNNDDSFKNQWSPFQTKQDNQFYDYREPDEISLVSERSCYSTTSDEEGDSYEIVDWNQYTDDYMQHEINKQQRADAYDTPLTSPRLDLSGLDGYQTAPNSPKYDISQDSTDVPSASREYENGNYQSDENRPYDFKDFIVEQRDVSSHNAAHNANKKHYDQSLCCRCGRTTESGISGDTGKMTEIDQRSNIPEAQNEGLRQNKGLRLPDSRILHLQMPPLISVNSVHYEADPETGRAKVIGRGSFGQVYKARFSDPTLYHLPIVIKEFNEEFTSTKEIIDEAKRLAYLQDTGFVPICYGLLCFGSPNDPKYGIVQEYVGTGLTLEQMLWDQYELPLEFWYRIVIQCCEGLARFHDKGILLNDIKTNNILLEFSEHSVRIRYIDFGLATDMHGKRYKNTKSLEDFVYLAPEVRQFGKVTTVASDIYSLGYILEQINKFTGMHELTVVARLCMDRDPAKRIPVRSAAQLLKDHMYKFGYDPLMSWDL